MGRQTFRATLERPAGEGSATVVRLPFDARAEFGRARAPVVVTIGGHTYRSTVVVYGGGYFVAVNREHRNAAGVEPGDTVEVTIEADEQPRVVALPEDLHTALANAGALEGWERLSHSHQREYLRWIDEAKRPATRSRRIAQAAIRVRRGSPVR